MPGILEFYPEIGFLLVKMCRIISIATFSVQVVITSNSYKRGKTAEKDKAISRKPPVMTFVLSCSVHRPVEYGSDEIAKGKSSPGARKTSNFKQHLLKMQQS